MISEGPSPKNMQGQMFRKEGAQGVDACGVSHTPEMVGLSTPTLLSELSRHAGSAFTC